jgi:hypothetical protein
MTTKEKILTRLINESAVTKPEAFILNDYKAFTVVEETIIENKSFDEIIRNKHNSLISNYA